MKKQIFLVPITIHTEVKHKYWEETIWASKTDRFEWYNSLLYPGPADTGTLEASSLLMLSSQLEGIADAWIEVVKIDPMRGKAIAYAKKLGNAGVNVIVTEYSKALYILLLINKLLELPVIDNNNHIKININFEVSYFMFFKIDSSLFETDPLAYTLFHAERLLKFNK